MFLSRTARQIRRQVQLGDFQARASARLRQFRHAALVAGLAALLSGCGSLTLLDEEDFTSAIGTEISAAAMQRLDRQDGEFTLNITIAQVYYEGVIKAYRRRGMMLGAFKTWDVKQLRINRKSEKKSLYGHEDDLSFRVYVKQANGVAVDVPFNKAFLSDEKVKFSIVTDMNLLVEDNLYVEVSIAGPESISSYKKTRYREDVERTEIRLRKAVAVCVTCDANKGI